MKSNTVVALFVVSFISLLACIACQQAGQVTPEVHPTITTYTCTKPGSCQDQAQSITIDAGWRWIHTTAGYDSCFTGSGWNTTICPDPVTCSKGCALDGADYKNTYGITTNGSSVTLQLVTGTNVGSRTYLLKDDNNYQLLRLKNKEFTFEVDVSNLPCGLNGALYLVEMPGDGGKAAYPNNQAGAKFGTGYCDAQCPKDIKFINGEANIQSKYGSCCIEMDIWEANKMSAAYTPHPCDTVGLFRCEGDTCVDRCDQGGCDFNSYRQGNTSFYGPGGVVDTTKPFTVVTQFFTADGTDKGPLQEIRRFYVQNRVVIPNSATSWKGISPYNSISEKYCVEQKDLFNDTNQFSANGGLKTMGESLDRGVVVVFSLWDDHASHMLWLDSKQPVDASESTPGVARGPCATTSGVPSEIESQFPHSSVTWSNVKWGPIGSTF